MREKEKAFMKKLFIAIRKYAPDVNGKVSLGNACLDRTCLQARQILPTKYSKRKTK